MHDTELDEDMPNELDLDWSKARRNPYVGQVNLPGAVVRLDADVA
jgi:hypothetical protein